jgi:hypothetical protein
MNSEAEKTSGIFVGEKDSRRLFAVLLRPKGGRGVCARGAARGE